VTDATLPAAVFWDMDGTLVDSEPYWLAAETRMVESFGGVWSQADGLQLVGSSLERSAIILQSRGVALGVDPRRSVAIEDSEYGVAAAVAAGMATIAVPLHVPLPESPAYTTWPDLSGSTPAALGAVLAARVAS
jgi:beta-phosphoglucomutase-like phosphatase (HAD superfamily)